jgi:hypothetical protein
MTFPVLPTKHKIGNGGAVIGSSLMMILFVALIVVTQLMESVSITKILSRTILISTTLPDVSTMDTKFSVTELEAQVDMHVAAVSLQTKDVIQYQLSIDIPVVDSTPYNPGKEKAATVDKTNALEIDDKTQFQRYSVMKYPASITGHSSQPKQNRTLVVVLGNIRGGEPTWRSMCRHLLDPNMADLAMLIGEGNPSESSKMKPTLLHERAKYIWTVPEFEDWADAMEDIPNKPPDWRKRLFDMTDPSRESNILLGAANNITGSGTLVFMFRFYLSQIIVENNFLTMYDRFVVTRSDHYYLCLNDLSELSNEYLWVPTVSDHNGICDRHFLANNETILSALDILPPLVRNPEAYKNQIQSYPYNTERFLLLRWQKEGLEPKIRRYNRTMFLAAGSTDQTRWKAKGRFMEPLGVHLKYPREYWASVATCRARNTPKVHSVKKGRKRSLKPPNASK